MRRNRWRLLAVNWSRQPYAKLLVVCCVALAACPTGACSIQKLPPYEYKLSFTLRDNQGDHTGSSAVLVHPRINKSIDGSYYDTSVEGEATAVRLGDGRLVFALLSTFGRGKNSGPPLPRDADGPPIVLSGEQMPLFLTFTSLTDPKSYQFVWPDNPMATLGPGVTFIKAEVSLTTEPVNNTIFTTLPWLKLMRSGDTNISTGDFGCIVNRLRECVFKSDLVGNGFSLLDR